MLTLPKTSLPIGVDSVRADARWVSSYSEDAVAFVRKYGHQLSRKDADETETTDLAFHLGPILSKESTSTMAGVLLYINKSDDEKKMRWVIMSEPRPDSEPPTEVIMANEDIGYLNGFIEKFMNFRPSHTVQYGIHLHVQESAYSCKLLPRKITPNSPDETTLSLSTDIQLEQVGYRIPNAKFGIQEFSIVFMHESNYYLTSIQAKGNLDFSDPPFFPYAESAIQTVLSIGFKPLNSRA